jgi:anti-sigma regulatory factor (Ser/Thr protein kinase)
MVLPAGLQAARTARDCLGPACAGWPASVVDVARLLTSELVTNAVRHGDAPVWLGVRCDAEVLRVEVGDSSPVLPDAPAGPPEPAADGGRGLLIVAELAKDWGATPAADRPGKTVWFELRASPAPP